MDRTKTQDDEIPGANGLAEDVIVSDDARREQRIPPGQARTKKWPVLDASGPPAIDLARWRFRVSGLAGARGGGGGGGVFPLVPRRPFGGLSPLSPWFRP